MFDRTVNMMVDRPIEDIRAALQAAHQPPHSLQLMENQYNAVNVQAEPNGSVSARVSRMYRRGGGFAMAQATAVIAPESAEQCDVDLTIVGITTAMVMNAVSVGVTLVVALVVFNGQWGILFIMFAAVILMSLFIARVYAKQRKVLLDEVLPGIFGQAIER